MALLFQNSSIDQGSIIQMIAPWIAGGAFGAIITIVVNIIRNRIQKMRCYYVDDDVITRIPVVIGQSKHQKIDTKEFKLVNTTNKDHQKFKIIFEFDAQSTILKHDTWSKTGKNFHKVSLSKPNECAFSIKNFNRGDDIRFNFEIANLNRDVYNVTEAECIGFKIIVKDKRQSHQKTHGFIVRKEDIN